MKTMFLSEPEANLWLRREVDLILEGMDQPAAGTSASERSLNTQQAEAEANPWLRQAVDEILTGMDDTIFAANVANKNAVPVKDGLELEADPWLRRAVDEMLEGLDDSAFTLHLSESLRPATILGSFLNKLSAVAGKRTPEQSETFSNGDGQSRSARCA